MTTTESSFLSASFLNLFGIVICIVLCILFLILGGHTLKYIKEFAVKIKIIANRAEDKNINLKEFNYQAREAIQNNESYLKWESIFKNEIKRSRSLQFFNILASYLSKYDHILYYPFRDRALLKYDLLKPKTSFYTWLVILSCCISWMTTIFLSAILQSTYSIIDSIPLLVYIAVTVGVAFISSILNIICVNRLMRIYVLNVKGAFKVDYGHKFLAMNQGLGDYEPENSIEEEEFLRVQEEKQEQNIQEEDLNGIQNPEGFTHRTNFREDTSNMNSTRKLLPDEFEKSDIRNNFQAPALEEVKEEDFEEKGPLNPSIKESVLSNPAEKKKGRAIKDIFDLQIPIEGVDEADEEQKYIFIEDQHAIGDLDLLENEAFKGENNSNITTFVVLFLVIAASSAICCYLNYRFPALLAQYVFYMFIGAWVGDIIITRVIVLTIMSLLHFCKGKVRGYKQIKYKSTKEVKSLLNNAIKDMFNKRQTNRDQRDTLKRKCSFDSNASKQHQNSKGFDSAGENNFTSNNNFDRNETSMKNLNQDYDGESYAQNMSSKRDNDQDGGKVHVDDFENDNGGLSSLLRPSLQMAQKNPNPFENTQVNAVHTQAPLLANLQKQIQAKNDEEFSTIMEKKQLVNELVDYNLLLLRKIYDAYEDRADKVLNNFRSDKSSVIRKRYMVPILNPNYDYERFIREMKEQGKAKDVEEENSVHLDGVTVCEDYEKQLMDAIIQEASDDLVQKKIDRQKIDKFGNPVDEEAQKNGIQKAAAEPNFGYIEHEAEENIEEDDEEGRRRSQLEDLQRRLANGEQLTEEELALLHQLEKQRLDEIENRLKELLSKGFANLNDEEKLEFYDLSIEKLGIENNRISRKQNLTEDDQKRLGQIQYELKRLDFERLKLLKQMGRISTEEQDRLNQLEQEFSNEELENLRQKLMDGTITEEEMNRLLQLLKETGAQLSDHEQKRLREMMMKLGMLSQEEADKYLVEELLQKLHDGGINKDELISLLELEQQYNIQFTDEEKNLIQDFRMKFGMLSQEELEKNELEELMRKLREGTLTADELRRLQELLNKNGMSLSEEDAKLFKDMRRTLGLLTQEEKDLEELEELRRKFERGELTEDELRRFLELSNQLGLKFSDEDADKLRGLRKKFGMLTQEELDLDELEELRRKLLSGEINEDELRRLMELQNKYGVQFSDEELQKLRDAEDQFNEMDQSRNTEREENFSNLPPVVLMNNTDSPTNLLNSNIFDQNLLNPADQDKIQQNLQVDDDSQFNELPQHLEGDQLFNEQNQLNSLQLMQLNIENDKENNRLKDQDQTPKGSIHSNNGIEPLYQDEYMNSPQKYNDIQFGRDDLEQNGEEESVYSHKTTTILDEEKVSFMHIEHLPNQDNGSEDSFDEQDMVYYNKDDLTNYSKGLGLNKVKLKQANSNTTKASPSYKNNKYYSENDLHEVQESEVSDQSRLSGRSKGFSKARSAMSIDSSEERQRVPMSRGQIQHNQLSPDDHSDLIDGRVKVDSWNLNYRGKKKQHKKRKVTKDQKRKMASLQEIYGIDAKTLAGLSQGRLPRKLLASGKLGDDKGTGEHMYQTENSLRSTQNTFMKQQTPGGRSKHMKESITDNQSNLFSFNGYGTSKRWNEIQSTLKGANLRESKMENISEFNANTKSKKFPVKGKMTTTQEKFSKYHNPADMTEEEEEKQSYGSGSRTGFSDNNVRYGLKNQSNGSKKVKNGQESLNKVLGSKGQRSNKNQRNSQSDGMDSHNESDEAVDDHGIRFQKRNYPFNGKQTFGGMNDTDGIDHSESDEGQNQENPDFNGNEFMFKKREAEGNSTIKNQNAGFKGGAQKNTNNFMSNTYQASNNGSKGGRRAGSGSSGRLELEDLEAQQISGMKGKQGKNNQSSSKKKSQKMRADSAERDDSEEENLGGMVNFQNQRRLNEESKGIVGKGTVKPPLAGSNKKRSGFGVESEQSDEGQFKNIAKVHPGVQSKNMKNAPKLGQQKSDLSDNNRMMRGNQFNQRSETEEQFFQKSNKKMGQSNSQPSLNKASAQQKKQQVNPANQNQQKSSSAKKRRNRSVNEIEVDRDSNSDEEDQDDFIVGPESNHSMIRQKDYGLGRRGNNQAIDEDDDQYLLLQRERQIMEDIQNDKFNNSKLAKKRKIRKAAQSQNPRDLHARQVEEMQNKRLQKKKREAEAALFSQEDDIEKGHAKLKKKKQKKDFIKKEINYWLDYDSPYAEYLVARFREWSPAPNPNNRVGSSISSQRQGPSKKMNEVKNVYEKNSRQGSSNQNSRSPERQQPVGRGANQKSVNVTKQQKIQEKKQSQNWLQVNSQNENNINFVEDFEEP